MRKIVLVLGMHRSATSLTTELLSSYGLYVGEKEDLWEPNQSNQRGFFENRSAVQLNDRILYEHGTHWAELHEDAHRMKETKYTCEIKEILCRLLEKAEDGQTLLLKDPRMCITEPIWKKQIDALCMEEHIVMVFRHPYEVAKSLAIRDNMNFAYALKLWFYNNYSALCCLAECDKPVLVLNHDDYFSAYDEQIRKIEEFLHWAGTNRDLDKIIDVSLRHNNVKEINEQIKIELQTIVFELYQYLLELSLMKRAFVSRNELEKFRGYLKKIVVTTYSQYDGDMIPKVFDDCLGKEKKQWCAYQLKNRTELLVQGFQQFREKNRISYLAVYGGGTLSEALIPILKQAGISVNAIYDRMPVLREGIAKYQIQIRDIREKDKMEGIVLNTAVNHGVQVKNDLSEKFEECEVLDLYGVMYEMLRAQ
ncbi:MAG: hypothetical protein HFH72_03030 [Lachnospiraceae bacterium]|nr:hypothetical protein [Lachnospiraceae bacterium]